MYFKAGRERGGTFSAGTLNIQVFPDVLPAGFA